MCQEEENTHQSYVWLWAFLRSCMHVYMHVRTYVPTYMHTYVRTYKCMHICTYVYMYFCEYLCWGELYTCDKVINGWLFMLFNAYIIKTSHAADCVLKLLSYDWRDVIGGIVYVIKIYASNDITNTRCDQRWGISYHDKVGVSRMFSSSYTYISFCDKGIINQ